MKVCEKGIRFVTSLLVLYCMSLLSCATADPVLDTSAIQGHWVGRGDIIVTWCNQDQLSFDIFISDDGLVRGRIGDATIIDGHVYRRSSFMRNTGNGNYIVRANLQGFLVKEERIARDSIAFMFDLVNGSIEGEMNTSGSKCGTRDRMYMKVANIILNRVEGE